LYKRHLIYRSNMIYEVVRATLYRSWRFLKILFFVHSKIKRDYPSKMLFGLRFIDVIHQSPRFGCVLGSGDVMDIHKHHI
jgi:hypothetical protein